jgi:hypothetical protein
MAKLFRAPHEFDHRKRVIAIVTGAIAGATVAIVASVILMRDVALIASACLLGAAIGGVLGSVMASHVGLGPGNRY